MTHQTSCPECGNKVHWSRLLVVNWRFGWRCAGCAAPLRCRRWPSEIASLLEVALFALVVNAALHFDSWSWTLLLPLVLAPNMLVPVQLDE